MKMKIAVLGMIAAATLAAQEIKIPANLEKLAERATEVVDVNMDSAMLQLASRFLSDKDPGEAKVQKLVAGLKSIRVKNYEFDRRGEFDDKDLEELRAQFKAPGWSRIVMVRSRRDGDNADVYLKSDGTQVTGVAVIAAEPRELTIVNVIGNINPDELRELSGHFGIPALDDVAPKFKDKNGDKNKPKDKLEKLEQKEEKLKDKDWNEGAQ